MINAKGNVKIIGIDHGYGNMKTVGCVFGTGVLAYDKEPVFKSDMLVRNGRYYLIGTGHKEFTGVNMLCDIGNGTMNLMFINDKKPNPRRCYTEKFGTHQCMLQVKENLMRLYHTEPPEETVTRVLRFGEADIDPAYLKTITDTAREYVDGIFRRLREHGYDPRLMKLYVVGGGGCLIKNFADYDENRVTINEDICATVKGYERMAEAKLLRAGDGK